MGLNYIFIGLIRKPKSLKVVNTQKTSVMMVLSLKVWGCL
ncbi:cloacin immunity protein [Klebsiella pneumoniae BIDMC 16]|jgi:hypothetical protein|nr:cloacin immunity protein [Klebsiella pneumoniae BIDMC 16]